LLSLSVLPSAFFACSEESRARIGARFVTKHKLAADFAVCRLAACGLAFAARRHYFQAPDEIAKSM
jgi:hypothetical protein